MTRELAFIRQARSDLAVFDLLAGLDRAAISECHPLHYFQMATEKLAKAAFGALGMEFDRYSHVAFSHLPNLLARRDVAAALGQRNFTVFRSFLRRAAPLFRLVEELSPAVGPQDHGGARDGPNVEYPWEFRDETGSRIWIAPADQRFELLDKLHRSGDAARMLNFVRQLLDRFESIFG